MNIYFNLSYYVDEKQILNQVKGFVKKGSCLTIMGPSGAGKSSLLNLLTLKKQNYTGEILYNGRDLRNTDYKKYISYVEQEDIFYPNLTVQDHLYFYSGLKLSELSMEERNQKVDTLLKRLRLDHCVEKRITILSGGEKKRLSILEELLSEKESLFLDEPTTGLDSFMADQVVEIIHEIAAKSGKTIVYTIHQPSYKIYDRFENILFLANGRVFFMGEAAQLYEHCKDLKVEIPQFANPAEFLLEHLQNLPDHMEEYNYKADVDDELTKREDLATAQFSMAGFITQYYYIAWRTLIVRFRERQATYFSSIAAVLTGTLVGLIFFQVPLNSTSVISRNGAVMMMYTMPMFQAMFDVIIPFVGMYSYTKREVQLKGLYSTTHFWNARTTGEGPIQIGIPMIFFTMVFLMSGITYDPFEVVIVMLTGMAGIFTAISYGYSISTLSEDMEIMFVLSIVIALPLFMMSNLLLNADTMAFFIGWTVYLSPFKTVSEILYIIAWTGRDIVCNQSVCEYATGVDVLETVLNIRGDKWTIIIQNFLLLAIQCVVMRVLGYIRIIIRIDYEDDLSKLFSYNNDNVPGVDYDTIEDNKIKSKGDI